MAQVSFLLKPAPSFYQVPRAGLLEFWRPTLKYWAETEVHVYALSIAASVMFSLFPFLIVMVSLCKYVLAWPAAVKAVHLALAVSFPDEMGAFLQRNLTDTVEKRGPFQAISVILLLFTANGIFVPLEVALNRAWGVVANRSYLKNQLVSLSLILLCGSLTLGSFLLTASPGQAWLRRLVFQMAAAPITMLALALVYWLLPNRKIPLPCVIPVAILAGAALEMLKYLCLLLWPLLREKLRHEYGPFYYSVTIILWSFCAAMIVLAGAEWSARAGRSAILE